MPIFTGDFLNIRPSVGILHKVVWVELPINATVQPVGVDARPALSGLGLGLWLL